MLLNKDILIKWHPKTKEHYESLGYKFTKYGDSFVIKTLDLTKGSDWEVEYTCDYCGKLLKNKYETYNRRKKHNNKDCCKKCQKYKASETYFSRTGFNSPFENPEVIEKIEEKNIEKYGAKNVFELEEFQEIAKQSVREKYGVDNVFQSEEIKEKIKKTNLERYEVEYPTQNKGIMEKIIKSRYENYNGSYNINGQNFINGIPVSKSQVELGNFLGGHINYRINNMMCDIFIEPDIVVEYDGGGHNLSVKINKMSQEDFDKREQEREDKLISKNYKIFRIINSNDEPLELDDIENWLLYEIDNGSLYGIYYIS